METLGARWRSLAALFKLLTLAAAAAAAQLRHHGAAEEGSAAWLPWSFAVAACAWLLTMLAAAAALWVIWQRHLQLKQKGQLDGDQSAHGGEQEEQGVQHRLESIEEEVMKSVPVADPAPAAASPPVASPPAAPLIAQAQPLSAPLLDESSGIISPFASFMPLFDPDRSDSLDEPRTPELLPASLDSAALQERKGETHAAPLLSTQRHHHHHDHHQQHLQHQEPQRQQQQGTAAAAYCPAPLPPKKRLPGAVGGWLSALLGRGWSAPAEVGGSSGQLVAGEGAGEGDSQDKTQAARLQLLADPSPLPWPPSTPPRPMRKGSKESQGSQENLLRYPSSSASIQSQGSQNGIAVGTSGSAAMGLTGPLDSFLDWELSPEEIVIMKRPDGSDWELGSGGFGKVYKALRNGVQPVAVKILRDATSEAREECMSDLRHEITILKACKDPNIVAFLGACLHEDATMLVTEYCEGGSLTRNIMRGKVSWYQRGKKVALDVARGLVFLHSRRIIHFDLKSPNILLARDGTAKVADVGMAKIIGREFSAVSANVGTLAWASPEMLLGARCTEKSDIYSFGVLLWEIATGETPLRGQLRDVRCPEECPASVRDLILDCLDPNPKVRPTAFQLVERLQGAPGVLQGEAPAPGPAPVRRALSHANASPRWQQQQERWLADASAGTGALPAAPRSPLGPGRLPLPLRAGSLQVPAAGGSPAAPEAAARALSPGLGRLALPDLGPTPTSPFAAMGAGLPWGPHGTSFGSPLHQQQQQQNHRVAQDSAARPPLPPAPLPRSSSLAAHQRMPGQQPQQAQQQLQPQRGMALSHGTQQHSSCSALSNDFQYAVAAGVPAGHQQRLNRGLDEAVQQHVHVQECPFYPLVAQQIGREHSMRRERSMPSMRSMAELMQPLHQPPHELASHELLSIPSGSAAHSMLSMPSMQRLGGAGAFQYIPPAAAQPSGFQPGTPPSPYRAYPHLAHPRSDPTLNGAHSVHATPSWHGAAQHGNQHAPAGRSMLVPQRGAQHAEQEVAAKSLDSKEDDWGRLLFNM